MDTDNPAKLKAQLNKGVFKGAYYVGTGAKDAPLPVLDFIKHLSKALSGQGCILRSGGSSGVQSAFEEGAIEKEIFLPYRRYNKNDSPLFMQKTESFDLAKTVHPTWHRCSEFARKIHASNVYQVLGAELNDPASFLLCWTSDGALTENDLSDATGECRTAIALAVRSGITVLNLANMEHYQLLQDLVEEIDRSKDAEHKRADTKGRRLPRAAKSSSPWAKKGFASLRVKE